MFLVRDMVVVADVCGVGQYAAFCRRRTGAAEAVPPPAGLQQEHRPSQPLQRLPRPQEGVLRVLLHQRRTVLTQYPGHDGMYPFVYTLMMD